MTVDGTHAATLRRDTTDAPLRAGMDQRRAVDTYFAIVNSTTYELLVVQRGWTLFEWRAWIADVIARELFGAH